MTIQWTLVACKREFPASKHFAIFIISKYTLSECNQASFLRGNYLFSSTVCSSPVAFNFVTEMLPPLFADNSQEDGAHEILLVALVNFHSVF